LTAKYAELKTLSTWIIGNTSLHRREEFNAFGGEAKRIQDIFWENPRERGHVGDPGLDGRIILRCIFRK
jgi:hypothetical protein